MSSEIPAEVLALAEARADWYFRNYPQGPRHDPRCLSVLAALGALYNVWPQLVGRESTDGGFRACGDGLLVRFQPGCGRMSTFDDGGMTALVIAAHRWRCRVDVRAVGRGQMEIQINPRKADGSMFERHPGLDDLAARCTPC